MSCLDWLGDPDSDPVFKNQSQYLNMDTLYRTGETNQGVQTYTPRLLSIGYQGSLGSMSSFGTLYNESSSAPSNVCTWTGNVSTCTSEPLKKNLFLQSLYEEELENSRLSKGISNGKNDNPREIQNQDIVDCLESDVQYWTDFSKVHFHPQSLYELNGLWMDNVEFDNYGIGRDIFSRGLQGEEISERLRFFVEECDHIQGFQFIVDDSGGFSAIAGDFLESIADEYTKTPLLLYTVRGPGPHMNLTSQKQKLSRSIHDALSFSRLSSFCKLIVPVGLPLLSTSKASMHLRIKDEMPYHSSAVYAAALHSSSVPFRIEPLGPANSHNFSGAVDVNGVIQMLAGQARQNMVTILDVAMPAPPISGEHVEDSLLRNLQPLTPEIAEDAEDMQAVEFTTVHGALRSAEGHHASISEVTDSVNAAYENSSSKPSFCHLSVYHCPLPIPLPFPKIFSNLVGQHGELLSSPVPDCLSRGSLDVHSIPVAARLRSSTAILPFLETRLANLRRLGIQQGAPGTELVRSWGFGKDELEDMEETLSKLVSTLDERAQLSDSD
ncbi:hypothetical protein OIU78_018071 [Salix suchowensis]|nr:hypothetical protein OIU78_018071 [Salix suchowensis]